MLVSSGPKPALIGSILFSIQSSPAIKSAEKAKYGLQDGSGGRDSRRLALATPGLNIGMRTAAERWRAPFQDRLVAVPPGAVVAEQRLRHEGHDFAVLLGDVLDDVLECHEVVGRLAQRV